jgi:hypothetical protein
MPAGPKGGRLYPVRGRREPSPPDYDRVVRRLSVRELASEIGACRGTPGYQRACSREVDRRLGL